jgi:hypothetical protein
VSGKVATCGIGYDVTREALLMPGSNVSVDWLTRRDAELLLARAVQ